MTNLENRARRIYNLLTSPINKPYRYKDICRKLDLPNSDTTHRAIRRAAEFANEDGLCLPCATPTSDRDGHGPVYVVTDDPAAVIDSLVWLASIANGVGVISDEQAEFIRNNHVKGLTAADRALFEALEAVTESDRAHRVAQSKQLKAITAIRRAEKVADRP